MKMIQVDGLTKRYPSFVLNDVSLSLGQGRIMGLIGRNGAGKTTMLKSMLNMVSPNAGRIRLLEKDFPAEEIACKQELGVVLGEINFYMQQRLSAITKVTSRFYPAWDNNAYLRYMRLFELDEQKKVRELSSGMRVKYLIALALSHRARLLILDEPTSGLDPVARDDLLEIFRQLVKTGERSILFSTHITSDLDKCADDITYLKDGKVLATGEKQDVIAHFQSLRRADETDALSLEEIMVRTEKRNHDDESAL